jgi:hypothetical protein
MTVCFIIFFCVLAFVARVKSLCCGMYKKIPPTIQCLFSVLFFSFMLYCVVLYNIKKIKDKKK